MNRRDDRRSPEAKKAHRLYKTARWKRLREAHRAVHPLCRYCYEQGRTTPMHSVDHIRPHKGDETLFFDPANLQSLCESHHSATKQAEERTGRRLGCDANGVPLDAGHHWRA